MYIPIEIALKFIMNTAMYFFIAAGISTMFFPTKLSLHPPYNGLFLGIGFTISDEEDESKYLFVQIQLLLFSIGIFFDGGPREQQE